VPATTSARKPSPPLDIGAAELTAEIRRPHELGRHRCPAPPRVPGFQSPPRARRPAGVSSLPCGGLPRLLDDVAAQGVEPREADGYVSRRKAELMEGGNSCQRGVSFAGAVGELGLAFLRACP
jgi:hypothetical protein